ncbi:(d)CMP kinase [Candidatus Symbiopectobacterium endolongispinus]|nr:hypothetical protein [Candidatus Symbiopectobacterium sp. PLON1]MBT9429492.1 (d)CMP kinase [Candidatus Symbiopectobacterium endolongispinus]
MTHSIILVGPRASGKTTVGKMLATRLHRHFIDTDDLVQKKRIKPSHKSLMSKAGIVSATSKIRFSKTLCYVMPW